MTRSRTRPTEADNTPENLGAAPRRSWKLPAFIIAGVLIVLLLVFTRIWIRSHGSPEETLSNTRDAASVAKPARLLDGGPSVRSVAKVDARMKAALGEGRVEDPPSETKKDPGRPRPASTTSHTRQYRKALAFYRLRMWARAFNTAEEHARTCTGPRKRRAEKMARSIRSVARDWIRAERSTYPERTLKYYQSALAVDRKFIRAHQQDLKKRIYQAAKLTATTSLFERRYSTSYAAYWVARKYGSENAELRLVMNGLERKAEEYLRKGNNKRYTNIAEARKLWLQVLRMVPPTNWSYQKAYQNLNNTP